MLNQIPKPLLNEFKSQKVTLFVGSGLSMNVGLPSWKELINFLQNSLDLDEEKEKFFNHLDPPQQAQYAYDEIGKPEVIQNISKKFRNSLQNSSNIHKIITTLPVNTIITTNWDTVLEDSFEKYDSSIDVIYKDNQIVTTINRRRLIKMHGTIQDPDSIIFSEDDYYRFANSTAILKQLISTILATSTILFVGYSYRDFNFKLMFHNIRDNIMGRKCFIFIPNITDVEKNYLRQRGLEVFSYYDNNIKKATENFFSELQQQVSIIAETPFERLKIMYRENSSRQLIQQDLLIRNQSNLGPLATPNTPKNPNLFGNEAITQLEIRCAQNWRNLIQTGAQAKCIISLNNNSNYQKKYGHSDTLQRLITLKENIIKYRDSIEVVNIGGQLDSNIDIYGNEVYLRSEKLVFHEKSYQQLKVIHDSEEIKFAIANFDNKFREIKESNLLSASELFKEINDDKDDLLHKYILSLIEQIISELN